MSLEMAISQQPLLPLSFQNTSKPLMAVSEYYRAAKEQTVQLSQKIRVGFFSAIQQVEVIRPIFRAAVEGWQDKMDKIGTMAQAGQALWDKIIVTNGGNNLVVGDLRKRRKESAIAGLKTMKIVPV